ncbi:hypothetical protein GWN42_22395 [candidate division KSB1 bacterium]|nr:hypothetical protein [candidate division KSB1 bacterium]
MPLAKVSPKHQITITKEIFDALNLEIGDLLEVTVENGKGVFIPKQLTEKAPAPKLSGAEQKLLRSAKGKIIAINKDMKTAKGLSEAEANVAAKVGLIHREQMWWWMEDWRQGEREAQQDMKSGRIDTFDNLEDLLKDLKQNE